MGDVVERREGGEGRNKRRGKGIGFGIVGL